MKTVQFIMNIAAMYNADAIVFEHLDRTGKKRGSKKKRLHLWRSQEVQVMTTDKAHRLGYGSAVSVPGEPTVLPMMEAAECCVGQKQICRFTAYADSKIARSITVTCLLLITSEAGTLFARS